jgi:N-acetylglutamate synthase-like GNAT family acetyltransferase
MFHLRSPQSDSDFDSYYDLRWRVLREPWRQPKGSERDSFDASGVHVMAESSEGNLLGCGCLHLVSRTDPQIRYMAVEESCRERGVGRSMVEWLEQQADKLGVTSIMLNSRESAVGFYQRLGYTVFEKGETLFGEINHQRMRKSLN